ncbi:uncharacterized protein J3D65DRAFT_670670 [Phyllosticta citribraziliensis]|uniref:Zinc-binding loop region of homing endonuclease domain-containing protein n=1 Tax=Phyllosticta citribraziliensis TaxID=989973 RepID=A0ABR1L9V7_9PEZI
MLFGSKRLLDDDYDSLLVYSDSRVYEILLKCYILGDHRLLDAAPINNRELLPYASPGSDNKLACGHLCLNGGGFNPDHVIIEPAVDNLAREECKGSYVLEIDAQTEFNPCSHKEELRSRKRCILPRKVLKKGHSTGKLYHGDLEKNEPGGHGRRLGDGREKEAYRQAGGGKWAAGRGSENGNKEGLRSRI